jgi:hypothetical protein
MTTFRATLPSVLTLVIALSACSHTAQDQTQWARAALARNTTLDVVSSDPSANTLTVRIKSTGETRTVRVADLIAALPSASLSPQAPPLPTAPPEPAAASVPETQNTADSSAQTEPAQPSPPPVVERAAAPSGRVLASGPGYSISDASSGLSTAPMPKKGETLVSGPGYSISDAGPGTSPAASTQAASAPARADSPVDSPVRNVAVEPRREPIICQGGRSLRIDGKNFEFDGDAISAENGCDLQITNSRIAAKGVAVSARNASVRIENSVIDGSTGAAILATDNAQVYAQQTTFKGVIRREDTADFHDLGGNVGN